MFELNSIRELNHRLSRLMDLSSGQKQYMGGEKANYFSPTNDNKPNNKNTLEAGTRIPFQTQRLSYNEERLEQIF